MEKPSISIHIIKYILPTVGGSMEFENIKMTKEFDEGTTLVIEVKSIEGKPGLTAYLIMPPDRREYLGMLPLSGAYLTEKELNAYLEEIEKLARKTLQANKLELFLGKKGFTRA